MSIRSKPSTQEYRDNYDRIFGKVHEPGIAIINLKAITKPELYREVIPLSPESQDLLNLGTLFTRYGEQTK